MTREHPLQTTLSPLVVRFLENTPCSPHVADKCASATKDLWQNQQRPQKSNRRGHRHPFQRWIDTMINSTNAEWMHQTLQRIHGSKVKTSVCSRIGVDHAVCAVNRKENFLSFLCFHWFVSFGYSSTTMKSVVLIALLIALVGRVHSASPYVYIFCLLVPFWYSNNQFIDDLEPECQPVHQQERQLVLLRENQRKDRLVNLLDLLQSDQLMPQHRFLHPTQRFIQHLFQPVGQLQNQPPILLPIPPSDPPPDQLLIHHLCLLQSQKALLVWVPRLEQLSL